MPDIAYDLRVDGAPASADLLAAVRSVEVEEHAHLASALRLELDIGLLADGSRWAVLDDGPFAPLASLRLDVRCGSAREALISGHVVEANARLATRPGGSTLEVVALDPTVLLGLEEKVRAWPDMADSDIAQSILSEAGLDTDVEATQPVRTEADQAVVQRGTDAQFLRQLAHRNGFACHVETDPASGRSTGHFHPPRLDGPPQGTLSVGMGEASNVTELSVRHAMLRPAAAAAHGVDAASLEVQSAAARGTSWTLLGRQAPEAARRLLPARSGLFQQAELQAFAQAAADRSAFALSATGELDPHAYGGILRARRTVLVRGAGPRLGGTYYVESVLHSFSEAGYRPRFSLRRNATGLSSAEPFGEGSA